MALTITGFSSGSRPRFSDAPKHTDQAVELGYYVPVARSSAQRLTVTRRTSKHPAESTGAGQRSALRGPECGYHPGQVEPCPGHPPVEPTEAKSISPVPAELEASPLPQKHWTSPQFRLGYNPNFLPVELRLETILGERRADAAKLLNGDKVILDYLHFSTVIDREHKFPMLTAININVAKLRRPKNSSSSWRRDIRLEEIVQPGDNFYSKSLGDDPLSFDRGHLVRRVDPCWGDSQEEVNLAEKHTFHFWLNNTPGLIRCRT